MVPVQPELSLINDVPVIFTEIDKAIGARIRLPWVGGYNSMQCGFVQPDHRSRGAALCPSLGKYYGTRSYQRGLVSRPVEMAPTIGLQLRLSVLIPIDTGTVGLTEILRVTVTKLFGPQTETAEARCRLSEVPCRRALETENGPSGGSSFDSGLPWQEFSTRKPVPVDRRRELARRLKSLLCRR